MAEGSKLLSEQALLGIARKEGRPVTPVQLALWRKKGLVPSPVRRFPGRGAGSKTLGYTLEAGVHVIAVASALRKRRSLDRAAWVMWLVGLNVTPYVRRHLLKAAKAWRRSVRGALQAQARAAAGSTEASGSQLVRKLVWGRGPSWLQPIRGAFRGKMREEFETVVQLVLEGLNASPAPRTGPGDLDPIRKVVATMFGDPISSVSGDAQELLGKVLLDWLRRELNATRLVDELEMISDDELDDMRDQFALWLFLGVARTGRYPVPPTPQAFLCWFAIRYISIPGSQVAFQDLYLLMRREYDGVRPQLLRRFQDAAAKALFFMPESSGKGSSHVTPPQ